MSVDGVYAYCKRLLKKSARKTCYAVNYRLEKSYGGFTPGMANTTSYILESESDIDLEGRSRRGV